MEKATFKQLDDIMTMPDVVGTLCTDKDGLLIATAGAVTRTKAVAGLISNLSKQCHAIAEDSYESTPVVILETENTCLTLKTDTGVTTAIYKHVAPADSILKS